MLYPIKDYPDYYITKCGQVWSKKSDKYIKPDIVNGGYFRTKLYKNGERHRIMTHRLVAKQFISNPNNYPYINHKDGIPRHNHISNLEWCTQSQNIQHAYDIGNKVALSREKHPMSKLTELDIKEIISIKGYFTQLDIANAYGVSQSRISLIHNNLSWTHGDNTQ